MTLENSTIPARLRRAIEHLPPEVRHRCRNSFDGFRRAEALLTVDREIASFRAITAEEEAAAALLRGLQLRGYTGASRLDLKLHQHKAAVGLFLAVIGAELSSSQPLTFRLDLLERPPQLRVYLPVSQFAGGLIDGVDYQIELVPPFGMVSTKDGVPEGLHFDAAVARVTGGKRVDKLIEKRANARNRILYAHDSGVPESKFTLESLRERERVAEVMMLILIGVLQTGERQAFVQQCLTGFLKIVGRAARAGPEDAAATG